MGFINIVVSYYGDLVVVVMGIVIRVLVIGLYIIFGYVKGF